MKINIKLVPIEMIEKIFKGGRMERILFTGVTTVFVAFPSSVGAAIVAVML